MLRIVQLGVFLCVLSLSNAWLGSQNACYAPPFFYGYVCESRTGVFGRPGHRIKYTIEPTGNAGTLLCCEVRACGPTYSATCAQEFKLYSIGCSSRTLSAVVPWGNNLAKPAIRCKGNPTGLSVKWSH